LSCIRQEDLIKIVDQGLLPRQVKLEALVKNRYHVPLPIVEQLREANEVALLRGLNSGEDPHVALEVDNLLLLDLSDLFVLVHIGLQVLEATLNHLDLVLQVFVLFLVLFIELPLLVFNFSLDSPSYFIFIKPKRRRRCLLRLRLYGIRDVVLNAINLNLLRFLIEHLYFLFD